jgi:hypothetical protein
VVYVLLGNELVDDTTDIAARRFPPKKLPPHSWGRLGEVNFTQTYLAHSRQADPIHVISRQAPQAAVEVQIGGESAGCVNAKRGGRADQHVLVVA